MMPLALLGSSARLRLPVKGRKSQYGYHIEHKSMNGGMVTLRFPVYVYVVSFFSPRFYPEEKMKTLRHQASDRIY